MSAIQYSGCPECGAVFRLPTENGSQSAEKVRCGVCHAVFNVAAHWMEKTDDGFVATELNYEIYKGVVAQSANQHSNNNDGNNDDNKESTAHPHSSSWSGQSENTIAEIRDEAVSPFPERVSGSSNIHEEFAFADEDVPAAPSNTPESRCESSPPPVPSNATERKIAHYIDRANPLMTFIWFVVASGFVLLLAMQVKYFIVPQYAQDMTYRQYLISFCKIAGCELAPLQNPFRFALTHTRIDLHPSEPGALRVTVKVVNQAVFPQPYPHIQLTLTDRVGRVVGRRTFPPNLYLPKGVVNMVATGQLAAIELNLARPHEQAVGFIVDIVSAPTS